jgi:short-subunit dehydrogenase
VRIIGRYTKFRQIYETDNMKVIIAGASSGIGRKLAELYAIRGDKVGIASRRMELLKEVQSAFPSQIECECIDVCNGDLVPQFESLIKKIGGLDIFIISAGVGQPSKDLVWEYDKMTVDTNVNGFIEMANWAFNYFAKQGHGKLATISSVAANRGGSRAPSYNASKAFQSNYFEGLSLKVSRMKEKPDIIITCIEPGFVDTKMSKSDVIFWLVPVEKASRQIMRAIDKGKRKVYISKRWWLIAKLMRWMPFWIYKRLG